MARKILYFLCMPEDKILTFDNLNQLLFVLTLKNFNPYAKKIVKVEVSDNGEVQRSRVKLNEIFEVLNSQPDYSVQQQKKIVKELTVLKNPRTSLHSFCLT